ncbi:MAG: YIP1 family protein [Candidatus Izemoplasmatales bacterium]|nr:YIP1 family protein [Candidatus Izemoplasmatales bacterium]
MKSILKRSILLVVLFAFSLSFAPVLVNVTASSSTTYTYALDDNKHFVQTQDAYLPGQTITSLGLNVPSDIAIDEDNNLVIADSGNKRVIVYNPISKSIVLTIDNPLLQYPTGVYVVLEASTYVSLGDIYIADAIAGKVFHFDNQGNLLEQFGKPNSIMYESLEFQPERIAVDKAGIMYIISKGTSDGIIQLSNTGDFLGFFSSNKVSLSLREQIQQIVYTDEQLENLGINLTPPVFTSVFIDKNGGVYSSSSGKKVENIKKHNTQGTNMISDMFVASSLLSDIFVDDLGIIYASSQVGYIDIYSNDGEFIYTFGTINDISVAGFFKTLSGIAVDHNGQIWTVDSGNSYLQSFIPTDYANTIYEAITSYNNTDYENAINLWNEVLSLNQLSILAHNGIAKNYLRVALSNDETVDKDMLQLALEHFKIAGNRELYSTTFWEIRNMWLQENLLYIVVLAIVFGITYITLKLVNKKSHFLAPVSATIHKIGNVKLLSDVMYMKNISAKPSDSFYYLRRGRHGSYLGAGLIMVITFFSYLLYVAGKGFIFQTVSLKDLDLSSIILGFIVLIGLFIICSYLVTSIQDGEGTFGEIFLGFAYSMYPFILACIGTTLFSYVATTNEVFLINTIFVIGTSYTVVLVFLSISEIQNYTFGQTIKSILLTLLFVIIILLVLSFIQMTIKQVFSFGIEFIKEAIRNVIG